MNLLSLMAISISGLCKGAQGAIQIVGYVILILKIALPVLIVGYGIFDLGKAVVADKDDVIKKAVKSLILRVVAGLAILLLPSLIIGIFDLFYSGRDASARNDFKACSECFLNPSSCNVIYN